MTEAEPWDTWGIPDELGTTQEELARQVEEAADGFAAILESAPEGVVTRSGAVGEWSMRDCLAHCVVWSEYCAQVLRRSLDGTFRVEDFSYGDEIEDPKAYNRATLEEQRGATVSELLSRFKAATASVADLTRALPRREWDTRDRYRLVIGGTITDHLGNEHGPQLRAFLAAQGS